MQDIDNVVCTRNQIYVRPTDCYHRIFVTLQAWQNRPDSAMTAFLCNGYQGSIKKAVMEIVYDNGVGIVIGRSCAPVGSEDEPEDSFAEPLLRLGPEVCN